MADPHQRAREADGDALIELVSRAAEARDATLSSARRRDGVVHTPPRLARAIIRQADALLLRHRLPRIGDRRLHVVDPACGPGIFLAATIAHAEASGAPILGLDVDEAALASTRASLTEAARARGFQPRLEIRDALEAPLTDTTPSVLVIGNPPWSARGRGPAYVEALLGDFRVDERGAPLAERRSGVLADAYVRFLRWSAEVVLGHEGGGALALVTNASYLDGPVHRGLRAFFVDRFDEVSVIDLGGSALVARAPGSVDENLFGVRPGAAVLLAARRGGARRTSARTPRSVTYRRLEGRAQEKLAALEGSVRGISVVEPYSSLRPRADPGEAWRSWPSLPDWLPFHREGIQTNRDALVYDVSREALLDRLERLARGLVPLEASRHFDPERARRAVAELQREGAIEAHVARVAYRPFEDRWAFLHPSLCHRPREPLLRALQQEPFALVSVRKDRGSLPFAHVALVRAPIDNCYLSSRSSCRSRAFPARDPEGRSNVAPAIAAALEARGITAGPRDVILYLAAIASSRSYARRYAGALALDYPRLPLPRDARLFETFRALGERLLLRSSSATLPPRAQGGAALYIGHHAFDADAPTLAPLVALRGEIDEAFRAAGWGDEKNGPGS